MEINEKIFEDYFSGQMAEDEIQQFNAQLNTNQEFNNEYQYFLSLKKATSEIERDNLRNQLNNINIEAPLKENKSQLNNASFNRNGLKWGLLIISLILLSYFSYNYFSSDNPEQIFVANYELYEVQNSRSESADDINSLYNTGKYSEFINNIKLNKNSPERTMMLANASIELGDFEAAEKHLLSISDDSSLRDLKYWYLGLISLKINHIPQAKVHFSHLKSISNFKKSEIEKILSQIKNSK